MTQKTLGGAIVVSMVLVLLSTPFASMANAMAPPTVDFSQYPEDGENWVLIAAALHDEANYQNDPDYIEAMNLYSYFIDHGFDDTHVILLVDFAQAPQIDGPATKGNIVAALDFLANATGEDSFVFISILDWGYPDGDHYYIDLSDEPLYDYELSAKVDAIPYEKMVINLVFRHSGGFIDFLKGDNRLVMASCKNNVDVQTHYYLSEGLTTPSADSDHNGRISFEEAFKYEKLKVSLEWDEPQPVKSDNIPGPTYAPGE